MIGLSKEKYLYGVKNFCKAKGFYKAKNLFKVIQSRRKGSKVNRKL